jgi:beta-xylosidase
MIKKMYKSSLLMMFIAVSLKGMAEYPVIRTQYTAEPNTVVNMDNLSTQKTDSARNPVIWADFPDPAVIRVGDTYYMSNTTMHMCPGLPIMKSKDLVNWEMVGYAYQKLEDNDETTLQNGRNMYGKGSWASSLRYHNGVYYATTFALNTAKTYIFKTTDIESGKWEEISFKPLLYDGSLFFDDDGLAYNNFEQVRNMLTQRTFGPECSGSVAVDVINMKDGDIAGLAALQKQYGIVGVKKDGKAKSIVMISAETESPIELESVPLFLKTVYLKIDCDFEKRTDKAYFYYSPDGKSWTKIGKPLHMSYSLSHFMGYRFALFNYSTKKAGGFVDFDYFRVSDKIGTL